MGTSAALHVRRSIVVTSIVFTVLLTACGSTGAGEAAAESTPRPAVSSTSTSFVVVRRPAEDTWTDPNIHSDYITIDPEIVFYAAPIVVVGTVREVLGPFWNSADGQRWTRPPRTADTLPSVEPGMYREIVVDIETVLRDDFQQMDSVVRVVAGGGGVEPDPRDAFRGGRYTEGETVVLFLRLQVRFMRDDLLAAYKPFWGPQGVFHVARDGTVLGDGVAEAIERKQNEIPDPEAPPEPPFVPEVITLEEFSAMIASIRDVRNEAAEGYRLDPSVVAAEIEFWTEFFETGVVPDPPGVPAPIP
ncbi:hypothetical protein MNBD_ACTINO02-2277 [hydrothermal vent metagenome]|uniref:Uncharacterized protein n=1 Tax=hydrothermal vent metagenome TaxID=652676 RepID=A0A3B0RTE4_9ZZZZ